MADRSDNLHAGTSLGESTEFGFAPDQVETMRRRRIIERVVTQSFPEEHAEFALSLWDTKYAHRPKFRFANFAQECTQRLGRTHELHTFLQTLAIAVRGDASKQSVAVLDNAAQPAPVQRISAPTRVFHALVHAVFQHRGEQVTLLHLQRQLRSSIWQLGFSTDVRTTLAHWSEQVGTPRAQLPGVELNLAQMQAIVHALYVDLCGQIGPADCDRQFSLAVAAADEDAAARDFSPRRLL